MTPSAARKFGRQRALLATMVILVFWLLNMMISNIKGDFITRMPAFFHSFLDNHILDAYIIILVFTWFFGAKAGVQVIINKRNWLLVTLRYVILLSMIGAACQVLMAYLTLKNPWRHDIPALLYPYFLVRFWKTGISLLFAWLWATWQMKKKQNI